MPVESVISTSCGNGASVSATTGSLVRVTAETPALSLPSGKAGLRFGLEENEEKAGRQTDRIIKAVPTAAFAYKSEYFGGPDKLGIRPFSALYSGFGRRIKNFAQE